MTTGEIILMLSCGWGMFFLGLFCASLLAMTKTRTGADEPINLSPQMRELWQMINEAVQSVEEFIICSFTQNEWGQLVNYFDNNSLTTAEDAPESDKDLNFLKEIKGHLENCRNDTSRFEMAERMIDDWINELENL